ncbi:MAG: glycerol-3-phosphate dehydrogenase/oxidase [Ignavibacteriales bacterium]|nr:glycerol-3-phosphate dehydrogenase/oxidase [Ignavibacteriales bacterium]
MNREQFLERVENKNELWDLIVIGGGATGLGTALESASRGYKTLLLEQHDFSKCTSSRSTKLIHGGVRYLQQGNITLVLEALHERGLLLQNAPHLVHSQDFIVPNYDWWNYPLYGIGLKTYDLLAGKLSLGASKLLTKEEVIKHIQNIKTNGLRSGIIYQDGQFDDSRLAINLAQTIVEQNGIVLNYFEVVSLIKKNGIVNGVIAVDKESEKEYSIKAKVVINATGIFTDNILKLDNPNTKNIITHSQGIHLIFNKEFFPGKTAIMIPHTEDGRVLFAVPWHNKIIVGTTDTKIKNAVLEPIALEKEIDFILEHLQKYISKYPNRKDIKSVFAGIRPLVKSSNKKATSSISRDHNIFISDSKLVTITGGKWTTYRKMGEDTIDQAVLVGNLEQRQSITKNLKIHGYLNNADITDPLSVYGSDMKEIKNLSENNIGLSGKISEIFSITKAEIIWHIKNEMARNVEDILARRTRTLFLDAEESIKMAPKIAKIISSELNKSLEWEKNQILSYSKLASNYLVN